MGLRVYSLDLKSRRIASYPRDNVYEAVSFAASTGSCRRTEVDDLEVRLISYGPNVLRSQAKLRPRQILYNFAPVLNMACWIRIGRLEGLRTTSR